MKVILIWAILFSLQAFGHEKFITRIHSISWSEHAHEAHLVKFQNARIGFFFHSNKMEGIYPGVLVEVEVTKDNQLFSLIPVREDDPIQSNPPFIIDVPYVATVVRNRAEAQNILSRFRAGFLPNSGSQDRAHVWAFEEYKFSTLHSKKAFLFYSDSFIRTTNHKWWFHVAPFVTYKKRAVKVETILDLSIARTPLTFMQWTTLLTSSSLSCKLVKKYTDYKMAQTNKHCYVLKESMYFWQPKDLESLENDGLTRVNFYNWEIDQSLQSAFGLNRTGHP